MGRFEMVLKMGEANFIRDMEYIYFALEQPEIRENIALHSFLKEMTDDWLRILTADTFRLNAAKKILWNSGLRRLPEKVIG